MNFLDMSKGAFAALLAVPAALAVLLYTARLRRKPQPVAFGALWRKVAERVSQTRRLGNLDNPLGLFLQLLAIALIALGAAHPRFSFQSRAPRRIVFVVDNSASMGAKRGLTSRFDEARSKALAALDRLSDADQVAVVTTGGQVRLLRTFSETKKDVRATLTGLDVVEGAGHFGRGLRYATELLAAQETPGDPAKPRSAKDISPRYIYAVTDGQETIPTDLDTKVGVWIERVGDDRPLDNVAITGFDVRDQVGAPGLYEAFVEVRNLSKRPITAAAPTATGNVRISADGKLLEVRPFKLGTDGRYAQSFTNLPAQDRAVMTAELIDVKIARGRDALAIDNTAWVALRRTGTAVRLVTAGNLYLTEVLRAQSRFQTVVVTPADFAKEAASARAMAGITVIDGPLPETLPPGNYILFNPSPKGDPTKAPFARGAEIKDPVFTSYRTEHPILRGAILADVAIARAATYKLGPGATVLAKFLDDPLIWTQEDRGRRMVVVGFAPEESNLPLRIAFPVLVYNAVGWLTQSTALTAAYAVGERFRVEVANTGAVRAMIRDPQGHEETAPILSSAVSFVGEHVGVYRIRGAGGGDVHIAANLFSADESRLTWRAIPAPFAKNPLRRSNAEAWPLLVVAAILILLVEWQLYHKRATT